MTVWSFVIALVVGLAVKFTVGFRAYTEAEVEGIDIAEHKESAYDLTPTGGASGGAFALAGISTRRSSGRGCRGSGASRTRESATSEGQAHVGGTRASRTAKV